MRRNYFYDVSDYFLKETFSQKSVVRLIKDLEEHKDVIEEILSNLSLDVLEEIGTDISQFITPSILNRAIESQDKRVRDSFHKENYHLVSKR